MKVVIRDRTSSKDKTYDGTKQARVGFDGEVSREKVRYCMM